MIVREQLKSKIHRAVITDANVNYEGSITIPEDFMEAVDLWEGEKVLVASISSGNRLETYVQPGPRGSGAFVINGGAAHRIKRGEIVAIMAFCHSLEKVSARRVICNEKNVVIG